MSTLFHNDSDSKLPEPAGATRRAWFCRLDEADDSTSHGQKACNLARMKRLGLTVPDGFVLPDYAFRQFLAEHGFEERFADILRNVDVHQPQSRRDASRQISEFVVRAALPVGLVRALDAHRDHWENDNWVVRSSAVGEDSGQAAFPGMLDSVLHVRSTSMLHDAIRHCWASYWSERCLFYSATRGAALAGMGVILQRQVPAAVSGVLFTRLRDEQKDVADAMVVECCRGLADSLVAGRVAPQRFLLNRSGDNWEAVDQGDDHDALLLDDRALAALRIAAQRLESEFGGPQDVEWSLDAHGTLHLLQSRPITTYVQSSPQTAADPPATGDGPVVYSNANVNENYPEPLTDFLQGIASVGYYHYFRNLALGLGFDRRRVEAMERPLRELVAIHGGRLYYNLTNIHTVLHMAPGGGFLADAFDQFTGASGRTRQEASLTWRGFRLPLHRRVVESCRIVWRTWRHARRLPLGVAEFEATIDALAAQTRPEQLAGYSTNDLLRLLRAFFEIRCDRWLAASLADAASMVTYQLLKRMLHHEFPEPEAAALHHSLLVGLQNVVSAEPAVQLWQLSRRIRDDARLRKLFQEKDSARIVDSLANDASYGTFAVELRRYLDEWGFRRSGELLLTRPSFQEQPAALIDMLRAYAAQDDQAPTVTSDEQHSRGEQEAERVFSTLRGRHWPRFFPLASKATVAKRLLAWTRQAIALRERARHRQALLYSRVRGLALALGDHLIRRGFLTHRDEVFFLRFEEMESLVERDGFSAEQIQALVRARSREHAHWVSRSPPETIELPPGAAWNDAHQPASGGSAEFSAGAASLRGTSACGGYAAGPAAVLNDIAEFDRLSAGDILVAPQTDPGWGPVFLLIRGLVIQRGGMLSHGAILAREYGIPTVVGVKDATRRIRHGQNIEVHGDRGIVELGD